MQLSASALVQPPPEPTTAEDAVMVAMMSLGRRMRQRLPGDELDAAALPFLRALEEHGPLRLSALACRLELDASTVSRHARHLEDRGLLERTGDPDDGRASRVLLSDAGRAALEDALARRRDLVGQALGNWTRQDRDHLRSLLTRLYTDLARTHSSEETA